MFFLEVLSRVVSIFAGIVGGLNGLVSLVQKCKPYIKRDKVISPLSSRQLKYLK